MGGDHAESEQDPPVVLRIERVPLSLHDDLAAIGTQSRIDIGESQEFHALTPNTGKREWERMMVFMFLLQHLNLPMTSYMFILSMMTLLVLLVERVGLAT